MVPHIEDHCSGSIHQEWINSLELTSEGGYQSAKRMSWVPDPPQDTVLVNSGYFDASLTTQEFPIYKIARQLVRKLLAILKGKDQINPWINNRPKLQIRAFTGD